MTIGLTNNRPVIIIGAIGGGAAESAILSTTTSINAKNTGTTSLYTVPADKIAIITHAVVRCTAADTVTVNSEAGIGIASGENDIFSVREIPLTAANTAFVFQPYGSSPFEGTNSVIVIGQENDVIKLGIDVGATATTLTFSIDLLGYTLDA